MRINFLRTNNQSINYLSDIVKKNDLIARLNPSRLRYIDYFSISNIQTYSDNSRYELSFFDLYYDRCYKNSSIVNENKSGSIKVFCLDLNFDMQFDFSLLSSNFLNYWKKNDEIDFIKPKIIEYNKNQIGQKALRSVACTYFCKMFEKIFTENILCFKKNNQIILAFNLDNYQTINNMDYILDDFLNAIYESVQSISGWIDLPPESGMQQINMQEWYDNRRSKNKKNKKYVMYLKK